MKGQRDLTFSTQFLFNYGCLNPNRSIGWFGSSTFTLQAFPLPAHNVPAAGCAPALREERKRLPLLLTLQFRPFYNGAVIPTDLRQADTAAAPETPEAPEPFEWTVHLAARQPRRTMAALLLCGAALALSYLAFGSPVFTLLVGASLFGSLADFFLPVRYRLTPKGAEARHLWPFAALEWKQVKRRLMSKEGLKLSPLSRSSRLDAYRGILLRFGDEDPEAVLEAVKRFHERYG